MTQETQFQRWIRHLGYIEECDRLNGEICSEHKKAFRNIISEMLIFRKELVELQ